MLILYETGDAKLQIILNCGGDEMIRGNYSKIRIEKIRSFNVQENMFFYKSCQED